MTFDEWREQATHHEALPEEIAGDLYAGLPGCVYPAGFMVETSYGWLVPLPTEEREFHTISAEITHEEPERFLWNEWCRAECEGDK
jgi:hypothetical protein